MAGKRFFAKVPDDTTYTLWAKSFIGIALSRKMIFDKKWQITLRIPWGSEILSKSLSRTVSKINAFLCFTQNFKMAAKMVGKRFLPKVPDDYV